MTGSFRRLAPNLLRAPLFVQVLALVLVSVIAAQVVNFAIVYWLPPPTPELISLNDVASALKRSDKTVRLSPERTARAAISDRLAPYQRGRPGLREMLLTRTLADELGVPIARTRIRVLGRSPVPLTSTSVPPGPYLALHGPLPNAYDNLPPRGLLGASEHFVSPPFEASVRRGDGRWLVLEVRAAALLSDWQKRILIWFAISVLALAPLAYLFARRLASPITAFASAAERLGRDPNAASVIIAGPAEIEVAASALNEMQDRLHRYVQGRTAMIGAVAHDLRTPLTRLRFRAEQAPEHLQAKLVNDIDQMEAMISATLAFVRDDTVKPKRRRLELVSLVESVASEMADIGLPVDAAGLGPVVIDGDPIGLRRLVTNLLDNAVKFGGVAHAKVYAHEGSAVVEVEDSGPGVPEGERERVFEPFHRGEPSRSRETGGAGLGLAVVRSIARAHGGDATVENRIEGGLRARARLPI